MTDTRLTYAVVGTGAIGGFYGSKLAHAGREVHFHRPMEIHYLYTRPIAEARAVGFDMPRLEMLERELLFIDHRTRRNT